MHKLKQWMTENSVIILFLIIGIIGLMLSGQPIGFVLDELVSRIARNSFLVLALIIPIIAGMGLNFGIVMGAMAGQLALLMVTDWGIGGLAGFVLAAIVSIPFSILFGYAIGRLLNKTKGKEMITGMIAGYFSNGLYQLLFLFMIGPIIPLMTKELLVGNKMGVVNTIDLQNGVKYALDNIWKTSLYNVVFYGLIIVAIGEVIYVLYKWKHTKAIDKKHSILGVLCLIGVGVVQLKPIRAALFFATVPMVTMMMIGLLCLFNTYILKTKLGQDFRTVGRNRHVANASGIDVDKVRIKAIIISTILAAWGQLIFLQNIGTLNTYGSHEQVGLFASAAILIGGATIVKATNKQAIIGVALFHLLFIVSPQAGQNLFDNAQIGEYFRQFIAYAVICTSIALYAWKNVALKKKKAE